MLPERRCGAARAAPGSRRSAVRPRLAHRSRDRVHRLLEHAARTPPAGPRAGAPGRAPRRRGRPRSAPCRRGPRRSSASRTAVGDAAQQLAESAPGAGAARRSCAPRGSSQPSTPRPRQIASTSLSLVGAAMLIQPSFLLQSFWSRLKLEGCEAVATRSSTSLPAASAQTNWTTDSSIVTSRCCPTRAALAGEEGSGDRLAAVSAVILSAAVCRKNCGSPVAPPASRSIPP